MDKGDDHMSKTETTKKQGYWNGFFRAIAAIAVYFILPYLQPVPFELLGIDLATVPMIIKTIYLVVFEALMIVIIVSLFYDDLKENLADLKKNHRAYFNEYLKYWFLVLILMMISNSIIMGINHGAIATNEETVRQTFTVAPVYMFLSAVVFAPIVEELVFRKSIRQIFTNDFLFIFLSGLIFGSLHVLPSYQAPIDLLYLIPYSIPGWVFAYTLKKSKNIFVPMGLHFLHNGILMSLQAFLYFFM